MTRKHWRTIGLIAIQIALVLLLAGLIVVMMLPGWTYKGTGSTP